jgi:hypothetical protein
MGVIARTLVDAVYRDKEPSNITKYESEGKKWKIRAAKHFIVKGIKPLPFAVLDDVLMDLNHYFSSPEAKK